MSVERTSTSSSLKSVSRLYKDQGVKIHAKIPDCFCFKHALNSLCDNKNEIIMTFTSSGISIVRKLSDTNTSIAALLIESKHIDYQFQSNSLSSYTIRFNALHFLTHTKNVDRGEPLSMSLSPDIGFIVWIDSSRVMAKVKHEVFEESSYAAPSFDLDDFRINTYSGQICTLTKAFLKAEKVRITSLAHNKNQTDLKKQGVRIITNRKNSGEEYLTVTREGVNRKIIRYNKDDIPFSVIVPSEVIEIISTSQKWAIEKTYPYWIRGYQDQTGDSCILKFRFGISYFGSIVIVVKHKIND